MASEVAQDIFVAYQPILDRSERVAYYQLLFRSRATDKAEVLDDVEASARVISYIFAESGIGSALGNLSCLVKVSPRLIMANVIQALPKDKVVLDILPMEKVEQEFVLRLEELKAAGYKFSLGECHDPKPMAPLFPHLSMVKVDITHQSAAALRNIVLHLRRHPLKVLAAKVEKPGQLEEAKKAGFDLFLGYYFARPHLVSGKRLEFSTLHVIELQNLLQQDADIKDLESCVKKDPGLIYRLFRLVHSAAFTTSKRVATIRQALVVLGRTELNRWVHLLLYAYAKEKGAPGALTRLAAGRARIMEVLAKKIRNRDPEIADKAYTVGVLSLIEPALGVSLDKALSEMSLAEDVKAAILGEGGDLRDLFLIAQQLEGQEVEGAREALARLGLRMWDLVEASGEGLRWADAIGQAVGA